MSQTSHVACVVIGLVKEHTYMSHTSCQGTHLYESYELSRNTLDLTIPVTTHAFVLRLIYVTYFCNALSQGRGCYFLGATWLKCVTHDMTHMCDMTHICDMWWLRLVGSFKIWVSFAEYRLFDRALLQKRPITLWSLLIVATPYDSYMWYAIV